MSDLLDESCKNKCQIFTPEENVEELLNWCDYRNNLYGKKVLEPTFGKGNILLKIVKKYIDDCLRNNISINEIKNGLENDIYGVEYDNKYYKMCEKSLNDLALLYGIENVKWNLYNCDFLKKEFNLKFDYIIGNPPYISYKLLDISTRQYVRKTFEVCKDGKFDYCYAFIEKGLNLLKSHGTLIYLIPGSIFKNVFSKKLRDYILEDLISIHDYGARKLFKEEASGKKRNILTSSATIIIERDSKLKYLNYYDEDSNKKNYKIDKTTLRDKWVFQNNNINGTKKFGDYFKVSNSIATLYNKAYVIEEKDDIYKEKADILLKAISPKNLQNNKHEKIIFPYYYKNEKLYRFTTEEFEAKYPKICNHLKKYDTKLSKRKSDENISWFEYGRSQALKDMNKPKLLTSIIVTNKVNVYELDKSEIPYSGIYIIPKADLPLEKAKNILESKEFFEYIKGVGINASGNSYRITSKDINNYYF